MASTPHAEGWPQWLWEQGWVSAVAARAEKEARECGDATVAAHHLALASTRDERTGELLERLGLEARRWRDYLNFILGVNAGSRAEREHRMRPGQHQTPTQIYHHGALRVDVSARSLLQAARREADRAGQPVGAQHLLLALVTGGGGIGTGTARWLGLAPTPIRRAAGLPDPPPQPATATEHESPRPRRRGPLVLFGGGALPRPAVDALPGLAGGERVLRVAVVAAAADDPAVAAQRCDQLRAALHGRAVAEAVLADRAGAHDPDVAGVLLRAEVIFLDGGSPQRLHHALIGTPALDALVAASDRGAVIAGYSAGSQALGVGARHGSWAEPTATPLLGGLPAVILPHCSGWSSPRGPVTVLMRPSTTVASGQVAGQAPAARTRPAGVDRRRCATDGGCSN